MLPGGTPASLWVRWNSAASASRSGPAELLVSMAGGVAPWLLVGHRPFDAEESLIVVGDDDEERRVGVGHRRFSDNSQVWCVHVRHSVIWQGGRAQRSFMAGR
jgi:hypothetical protein